MFCFAQKVLECYRRGSVLFIMNFTKSISKYFAFLSMNNGLN